MKYDIKDIALADEGKKKIEWAALHMPVLQRIQKEFAKKKALKGVRLAACLHVTSETANLMIALKAAGADVHLCASNPLSTQDEVAAGLVKHYGIPVYAITGEDNDTYYKHLNDVLDQKPNITMDDGADLVGLMHSDRKELLKTVVGSSEETTTGVIRLRAMAQDGALKIPVLAVNDNLTKHLFDNRYGTGQSTIDGYLRAMNLLMASKRVVVVGYGWVGRGVATRCHGMGSKVIVTEVDPVKALEAHMDGFEVMPMSQASKVGDIFITCTGMTSVIRKEHILQMKDGAIMGNVGHFDVEIDSKFLLKESKSVRRVRPNLDECTLRNGKRVYLIGEGRLANLVAAEGHPPEVMAQSFSNQILSILYILKNHKKMKNKIINVPEEIDRQVAVDALKAMDVKIDKLTSEQVKYMNSW